MKYVLSWNNEYLDMQIISGPSSEETAREEMKKAVIERLMQLGMEATEARYLAAENAGAGEEEQELHVSPFGASVIYDGGYEERYQIVDYGQDEDSTKFEELLADACKDGEDK